MDEFVEQPRGIPSLVRHREYLFALLEVIIVWFVGVVCAEGDDIYLLLRSFFCVRTCFCVWCGLQKRVVRPPPLDNDDDKRVLDGVVTSFCAFSMSGLSSLENRSPPHIYFIVLLRTPRGTRERERERERDARNHHRGARVLLYLRRFFREPPRKFSV